MGKGGGGGGQTTSTVTNTNIPEYARGYVENMLGATQNQLFNTTTNPTTGETELGSLRPYQAYGGTYDSSGNMTSYDPSKAVAGFTPMQQMAQNGIYNLQMPGQFDAASQYTADAMQRAANAGYNPGQFTMGQAYAPDVNYYQMDQPTNIVGQQAGGYNLGNVPTAQAEQGRAQTGTAQTGKAAQFGDNPYTVGTAERMDAARLGNAPTMEAQLGNAAQLGDAATMKAEQAGITQLGDIPTYRGQQLSYNPSDVKYDRVSAPTLRDLQMQAAADVGTSSFTQPGSAQAYMSPYMQNVVDIQQREAQRQADIAGTKRGAQFAQAGAFGGSRQAIENAEAARNLATQKGDIQSTGLQSAFQAAQQQFNTEQQARLQAELANQQVQQQAGVQNLSALLQTQGLGAQTGMTAQQLNQAAGIDTSKFNQQQQYNTSLQNAQMLQQQQLANQSMQGQYGLQQGQMNQAVQLQNAAQRQAANAANQGALNQFGLQQGSMDQQMAMANLANQQQAAANNQQYGAQYGIQQAQLTQAANAANQAAQNQINLADQALLGQFGLTQGQFNQQMAMGNVANQQQMAMANLANQQQNMMGNTANRQQAALANQALQGQYGLQQGTMSQANNQFNAQQLQAANLANQQMAYNTNNQNLQANLGVQQLGAGQNMQAQLANQQAMLANQQAIEQSRQFGANYGQQMNAQQLAAAQQLAGIGGQQLTAQQGIYGLQNQIGGQQQQLQQQIINQSMQDYANAQQYPLMQLGTMSNMLRGLPMQASTTNMYQAAPNAITQGIGAVGAYGALNGAFGGRKKGGVIHAAQGGIMSYDVGGEIESTLSKMDVDDLKRYAKESNSPTIKQMAARLIQEKSMPVPRMARGGILAFARGNKVDELAAANEEGLASPDGLTAQDVEYSSKNLFGGVLTNMLADRHAQSFGYTRPTTPAAPPPAPTPASVALAKEMADREKGGANDRRNYASSGKTSKPDYDSYAFGPDYFEDAYLHKPNRDSFKFVNNAGITTDVFAPATPPAAPPVTAQAAQAAPIVAPPAAPVARPSVAAPAGIKGAPAYPGLEPIPDTSEHIAYRAQVAKANEQANKTVAQHLQDVKAEQVAAGLEPENTGMKDYRARIMAERANIDDESKRQKNLRLAEFFASWGSTPGATLVAGMSALKKTIPTLIEDEKERKKATREVDKIIYELDQAVRLEKKGDINAAADRKQNAAKIAEPYNATLAKIAQDKSRDALTAQGNKAQYQSSTYHTDTVARTSSAATAAQAAATAEAAKARQSGKLETLYNGAITELNNVRTDLDKARKQDDAYQRSLMNIQAIGTVKKPNEQEQKMVDNAKNYIKKWEQDNAGRTIEIKARVEALGKELGYATPTAPPPAPAAAPVAPPGHTFAGYSTAGNPLYRNAQGQVVEDRK